MVMELCDGEMLSTITEERGAVGAAYAAELVSQVTKALQAAHALGIVHRDLKPANIMVVHPRPDQPVVKVLDFGIAVSVHTQGLSPGDRGRVFGTPAYMAPEQAVGGPIDHRADLYAVGAILYELLSGRAPFGGESAEEVLEQVRRRPPKPLKSLVRDVPPELELLVRRSLAKDPAKRPGSAREMERVLAPFAHALHQPVPHVDHDSAPPLPLVSRTSLSEDETKSSQRARLQLVSESSIPPRPTMIRPGRSDRCGPTPRLSRACCDACARASSARPWPWPCRADVPLAARRRRGVPALEPSADAEPPPEVAKYFVARFCPSVSRSPFERSFLIGSVRSLVFVARSIAICSTPCPGLSRTYVEDALRGRLDFLGRALAAAAAYARARGTATAPAQRAGHCLSAEYLRYGFQGSLPDQVGQFGNEGFNAISNLAVNVIHDFRSFFIPNLECQARVEGGIQSRDDSTSSECSGSRANESRQMARSSCPCKIVGNPAVRLRSRWTGYSRRTCRSRAQSLAYAGQGTRIPITCSAATAIVKHNPAQCLRVVISQFVRR